MAEDKKPLLIKRYASRRLYNTETSDYVTLEDIAGFIREGREVRPVRQDDPLHHGAKNLRTHVPRRQSGEHAPAGRDARDEEQVVRCGPGRGRGGRTAGGRARGAAGAARPGGPRGAGPAGGADAAAMHVWSR